MPSEKLPENIRNLEVEWSVGDFYGLADWATFEAGINKGLEAAAQYVEANAAAEQAEPAPADPCKHPVWGQDNDGTRVCAKCGLVEHPAARSGAVNEPVSSHWPEAHEVADIVAEGNGFWRSCSGCHELNEGHPTGPWSVTLGCNLGCGCDECGGIGAVWDTTDYADMGEALAALEPAEPATDAEPVGVGVFRNGKMIGFVGMDGEEYKLPEDTDERKLLYTSPQPKTATDEGPVAWLMNGKGDNWEERNVVTFDEDTARMKADTEWWTVHPLFTSPQPDSRLREAFARHAEAWSNVLELNLIPERHRSTAIELRDHAHALAQGADDERS